MENRLEERCELFIRNMETIGELTFFEWSQILAVAASIFTEKDAEADLDALTEAKDLIKKHFGAFSNARGTLRLPLMANAVLSGNTEEYLEKVKEVDEAVRKNRLLSTDFDFLSAMILAGHTDSTDCEETVSLMREIFQKMRKNHPFLTDQSDLAVAAMFALTDRDPDALISDMEECFAILKPEMGFLRGNEAQTTAALLSVMDGPSDEKCRKVIDLMEEMDRRKISLRCSMALPVIGGIAAIDRPVEELAGEIEEVYHWLKGKKGFEWYANGREGRRIFAAMLVLGYNASESRISASYIQSALASIIILEIVITMLIIISASASSSSHSSSH